MQLINKYDQERFKGKSPYEALGCAAHHLFYKGGNMDELIRHFEADLMEYTDKVFRRPSLIAATEQEEEMKRAGHKESDFA